MLKQGAQLTDWAISSLKQAHANLQQILSLCVVVVWNFNATCGNVHGQFKCTAQKRTRVGAKHHFFMVNLGLRI